MPVIIVGSEKNFAALRPRLFSGRVSKAALQEVTDAVAAANPHTDLQALEPGTILTIPESPHLSGVDDISFDDSTKELVDAVADSGAETLDELVATARAAERNAAAERKQLVATLARPDFDAIVKRDNALAADVAAVKQAVTVDEQAANQRETALKEAQTFWKAELTALRELLG